MVVFNPTNNSQWLQNINLQGGVGNQQYGPTQPLTTVNYTTPRTSSTSTRTGSVLGSATSTGGTGGTSNPQPAPAPQPSGPSDAERQAQMMAEIENVFNPQMAYLGQAESQLRGDLPNALAEAESQFKTNQSLLTNKKAQAEREIGSQETAAGTRKEDAMTAARRLYGELQMGGRQRFGGSSSAGEAFSELSQRELMRNQGGINTNFQTAMAQLGQQKMKVDEDFQSGLLQLEQQKQASINQVNRDFQNKLLEISRMRAEAESSKAQMRLGALQDLRNQVYAIQLQNQQFQQQLQLQRTQGLASVDQAAQSFAQQMNGAGATTQQFAQAAPTQYQTANVVSPTSRTATSTIVPQTGSVAPRRLEDYIGYAAPATNPNERLYNNIFGGLQ